MKQETLVLYNGCGIQRSNVPKHWILLSPDRCGCIHVKMPEIPAAILCCRCNLTEEIIECKLFFCRPFDLYFWVMTHL